MLDTDIEQRSDHTTYCGPKFHPSKASFVLGGNLGRNGGEVSRAVNIHKEALGKPSLQYYPFDKKPSAVFAGS